MAEESPRQDLSSESKQDDRSEGAVLSEESETPTWKGKAARVQIRWPPSSVSGKAEVFAENEEHLGGEGCEKLLWGVGKGQVEAPALDTVAPEFSPAAGRPTVSAGERRGETWHAHWVRKETISEKWWTGRTGKFENAMKAMRKLQRKERAKSERQTVDLRSGRLLFRFLKAE